MELGKNVFQRNGTHVEFPTVVSENGYDNTDIWNNIILDDINRILKMYSAYAFSPSTDLEGVLMPDTLNISYEIKRNDNCYLSILYIADFYSPYAAYPTQLIYTTNIDLKNNIRIRLSDMIEVDNSLIDNITSWEIVNKDINREIRQAIMDYIMGLGNNILLMGFESADIISSDNFLGIYSYMTSDRIGISMSLPNYLGGHVEFEYQRHS